MRVTINLAALGKTRWHEYLSRFLIGGATTAFAGLIAKKYGPGVGGLFLAFPAIFPASATLISSHEKKEKHSEGLHGTARGRKAAALDAAGASMGALGLLAFALILWKAIESIAPWMAIAAAIVAWLVVSITTWRLRQLFF